MFYSTIQCIEYHELSFSMLLFLCLNKAVWINTSQFIMYSQNTIVQTKNTRKKIDVHANVYLT